MTNSNLPAVIPEVERTSIARVPKAKSMVVKFLTILPDEVGAEYPEYRYKSLELVIDELADFVINQFKKLSINQIRQAFVLNDAGAFGDHISHYGKIDRKYIGLVLAAAKKYYEKTSTGHDLRVKQQMETKEPQKINVQSLLANDYDKLKVYGATMVISGHVEEKYEWLKENREDFNADLQQKKPEHLAIKKQMKKRMEHGILQHLKVDIPVEVEKAYQHRLKSLAISRYLLSKINTKKQ